MKDNEIALPWPTLTCYQNMLQRKINLGIGHLPTINTKITQCDNHFVVTDMGIIVSKRNVKHLQSARFGGNCYLTWDTHRFYREPEKYANRPLSRCETAAVN